MREGGQSTEAHLRTVEQRAPHLATYVVGVDGSRRENEAGEKLVSAGIWRGRPPRAYTRLGRSAADGMRLSARADIYEGEDRKNSSHSEATK